MIKPLLLSVALTLSAVGAAANQTPGKWICDDLGHPILEIERYLIKMPPDVRIHVESYEVSGLTRVWYLDDNGYARIQIKPDGRGAYLEGFRTEFVFSCRPKD